jgi:hypothetical protein
MEHFKCLIAVRLPVNVSGSDSMIGDKDRGEKVGNFSQ